MAEGINESDWKIFRKLREVALERFCQQVLDEAIQVASDKTSASHDRYVALYELLKRRDHELDEVFDSLRRSTAFLQLANMDFRGLLTAEEMSRFGPETREVIERYREVRR